MVFQQAIASLHLTPKKLFFTDGLGAVLSAFLLGVVLVEFEPIFGIPRHTLYVLACFPIVFAIYDAYCYLNSHKNPVLFLRGIALMNLLYCCLSIGLLMYHYQRISLLGWTYIILEIIVIVLLVLLELHTAARLRSA